MSHEHYFTHSFLISSLHYVVRMGKKTKCIRNLVLKSEVSDHSWNYKRNMTIILKWVQGILCEDVG
jgi:hypothetical protein